MAAMLPYVMRTRAGSTVYYSRDIDVENALAFVHRRNAGTPGARYSLFGVVLAAAVRVFALKPRLNRFVNRRGMYEHRDLHFSFIVKPTLTESAPDRSAKIRFEPSDTVSRVVAKTNAAVDALRSAEPTPDEREMSFVGSFPGGRALSTFLFRLLDSWNLAPLYMLRSDPLFTSAYFANLGSLGLETPYHHLYEWGTASLFITMGRIFRKDGGKAAGRRCVTLKISLDERIADGIYFAHAASLMARFIGKPEELDMPLDAFVAADSRDDLRDRPEDLDCT